ncbi:MAG: hypothetical protein J3Q66DRAFT_396795 [Benniella sp.]|nr:MAG: hypothetical protein J3Q66DRAFT_396795 [Benniella sp.]
MILLVDVDSEMEHSGSYSTRGHRPTTAHTSSNHNQRQLRAANDNTTLKGPHNRGRRAQSRPPKQNGLDGALCGLDFLETILQGLAKGALHHIVPVAISSTTSQDRILELFNLGVADVLLKPIEEQAARTLFLNVHRYNKYRTAVTIPRYATQKNSLALPSHTRLRNVFLKDQWLSDILISHYCPPPSKMTVQDFPSMTSQAAQERVKYLKKRLLSWDFHPHDLSEDDLMRCVVIVVREVMKLDGLGDLNIPEHLLHRFVIGLRDSYHRSNPYHNFAHAVDVLQATFYFLCRMGKLPLTGTGYPSLPSPNGCDTNEQESQATTETIPADTASPTEGETPSRLHVQDLLRPEDIFALIVASIGHDVGHPGVNNMFLINAHTPLAQVYNDRSVLESFHSMALFQVMKKHGFECFDVESQNRKFMEFRKMVVSTILATDMGLHFDYVGKIKEQTERLRLRSLSAGDTPKPNQASIDEQERFLLCGSLIKCADISNASRPFHVAERWSAVLLQEMCNQADIEKEMAVCSGAQSVPAGSTKSLANDPGMQIDSQLGFIHGFAMPLFSSVKDMIPEMSYCVEYLQTNHQIWQERKAEYLKTGGGGFLFHHHARPSSEDEEPEPKPVLSLRRHLANSGTGLNANANSANTNVNHGARSRNLNGKAVPTSLTTKEAPPGRSSGMRKPQAAAQVATDRQGLGSQTAAPSKIRTTTTVTKRLNVSTIPNGSAAEPASPSTAIPRPRPRTRTLTSEGVNTAQGTVQQQQQQQGVSGGTRYQDRRPPSSSAREPVSRMRTGVSGSGSSISASSDGTGAGRASTRPVSPLKSRQRSPGRRPQGLNGQRANNAQRAKPEVNTLLSNGTETQDLTVNSKVEPPTMAPLKLSTTTTVPIESSQGSAEPLESMVPLAAPSSSSSLPSSPCSPSSEL